MKNVSGRREIEFYSSVDILFIPLQWNCFPCESSFTIRSSYIYILYNGNTELNRKASVWFNPPYHSWVQLCDKWRLQAGKRLSKYGQVILSRLTRLHTILSSKNIKFSICLKKPNKTPQKPFRNPKISRHLLP